MSDSVVINKAIRDKLSPILKEKGFTKINTRNNWAWIDHSIWVLTIESVGKYFSEVTGWTSSSIHVNLGIYYDFIPSNDTSIKMDKKGYLLPKPHQCHLQSELLSSLDQSSYTSHFENLAEKKRKDIWWVETDDSNASNVIEDITTSFVDNGLPWLIKNTNLESAFQEIEKEPDSLNKFYKALKFSEYLDYQSKFEEYTKLINQEREKISRF